MDWRMMIYVHSKRVSDAAKPAVNVDGANFDSPAVARFPGRFLEEFLAAQMSG
jgi:hypothetical protein